MDVFTITPSPSLFATLPAVTIAFSIWLLELRRKAHVEAHVDVNPSLFAQFVRRLGPELAGLLTFVIVVTVLTVYRRDLGYSFAYYADHDVHGRFSPGASVKSNEVHAKIETAWPLLGGADSLLAMQAMLRVVLAVSAACRAWVGESLAIIGTPSAFFLLASICRVVILACSPLDVFYLDGPLGGLLNVAFEVAAVPPLLFLSFGVTRQNSRILLVSAIGLLLASVVAHANAFGLAYDEQFHLDDIFSLVQLLDALGAIAFVLQQATSFCKGLKAHVGVGSVVVYVLLPMQQVLAAYFFLHAFSDPLQVERKLVRRGRPFELMWVCGAVQVGCPLLAGALYSAACFDGHKARDEVLERVVEV